MSVAVAALAENLPLSYITIGRANSRSMRRSDTALPL